MTYSQKCVHCAQLSGAAAVTAALAMGLVAPPHEGGSRVLIESRLVQLEVAVTNVTINNVSTTLAAASTAPAPAAPSAAATVAASPNLSDVLTTVARAIEAVGTEVGRVLAAIAGLTLAPLYYLTAPISFPIALQILKSLPSYNPNPPNSWGFGSLNVVASLAILPFAPLIGLLSPAPAAGIGAAATARSAAIVSKTPDSGSASLRRNPTLSKSVSRQASAKPAAASTRTARPATAVHASNTPKAAAAPRASASRR